MAHSLDMASSRKVKEVYTPYRASLASGFSRVFMPAHPFCRGREFALCPNWGYGLERTPYSRRGEPKTAFPAQRFPSKKF
jgi:hypothetical protein